jgi:hypothetical protein
MNPPEMFIVAGPPGAGEEFRFPFGDFRRTFFYADDRAVALYGGSWRSIPLNIRHPSWSQSRV